MGVVGSYPCRDKAAARVGRPRIFADGVERAAAHHNPKKTHFSHKMPQPQFERETNARPAAADGVTSQPGGRGAG